MHDSTNKMHWVLSLELQGGVQLKDLLQDAEGTVCASGTGLKTPALEARPSAGCLHATRGAGGGRK
jgi:hypothetical protein